MIGLKLPPQLGAGQDLRIFSGIGGIQSCREHDVAIEYERV